MRQNILTQARAEYRQRRGRSDGREAETTIGSETVSLSESKTTQTLNDSILSNSEVNGVPRGAEAYEAREISETAPFQMILNAVVDQLTGGELAFPSDDGELDSAEAELRAVVSDVLDGPHHGGTSFDDLVSAWVADMAGPGNAYAEPLRPESGDLPAAALKDVDALTVRHHVDRKGSFQEPAFYQAPFRGNSGGVVSLSGGSATPLQRDDLIVMSWPKSHRSYRVYPLPPSLQVKEWLEVIADSTKHHGRFYKDNELPPGLLTAREANQTDIDNIRDELEAAKGDPRSAPVVGTDARWVEVGGSAVDLNVIEEQKWFLQLVMAAFGVTKTELAMDEEVNYETSEAMLSVVNKRVTQPLASTIADAIETQLLPQFDVYQQLDQPFGVELTHTDPREQRAKEEVAIEQYQQGALTYSEMREQMGDDLDDVDTTTTISGQTIDWSALPKPVLEAKLVDLRNDDPPGAPGAGGE